MIGASLSRWTLSYFATALTALIAAEVLMTVGFGFPSYPIEEAVDGVHWADVSLTYDPPWTPDMMSSTAKEYLGFQ
ncbi:hypothetical protein XH99_22030 [Bradyrhizobium nanningense]|uniref:Uncharacterized protein n=1 Tax=Bradyrhizobium nanningense TaxID=1325118 RepID=A0A4Q0S123_9BRAD|nr:hypothetical protein [Bradyrhizobium nanningense]RXH26196.1 hypothetical protein XH99_22030 [Bradyrhizobium nanningense]RXH29894.1 hypothetical protein XH84_20145 [Bradyrhizobium nanningense]